MKQVDVNVFGEAAVNMKKKTKNSKKGEPAKSVYEMWEKFIRCHVFRVLSIPFCVILMVHENTLWWSDGVPMT